VCVAAMGLHSAYTWENSHVAVDRLEWTDAQLQDAKQSVQELWLTQKIPVSSLGESVGERQPDPLQFPVTPFQPGWHRGSVL
jgi:hypothetical protein